jgi:hypothetical protein
MSTTTCAPSRFNAMKNSVSPTAMPNRPLSESDTSTPKGSGWNTRGHSTSASIAAPTTPLAAVRTTGGKVSPSCLNSTAPSAQEAAEPIAARAPIRWPLGGATSQVQATPAYGRAPAAGGEGGGG